MLQDDFNDRITAFYLFLFYFPHFQAWYNLAHLRIISYLISHVLQSVCEGISAPPRVWAAIRLAQQWQQRSCVVHFAELPPPPPTGPPPPPPPDARARKPRARVFGHPTRGGGEGEGGRTHVATCVRPVSAGWQGWHDVPSWLPSHDAAKTISVNNNSKHQLCL